MANEVTQSHTIVDTSYTILKYAGKDIPSNYKNLVLSKWKRSLRYGNDYFMLIEPTAYYEMYSKYIEFLLNKPNFIVSFAVLTDDPDVVLGWSAHENDILHYCHIHKDQRNQGIATALIPKNITIISHLTRDGIRYWTSRLSKAVFNPFK